MNLIDKYYARLIKKSDLFNEEWYRAESGINPGENAALHYVRGGWKQWNPSERFSNESYFQQNPGVQNKGMCPLIHHLMSGGTTAPQKYRDHAFVQGIRRGISRKYYGELIKKNKDARILVCLQMFYPESWDTILQYLKNLEAYHFDLIVTYQRSILSSDLLPRIRSEYPNANLIEVDNVGFDIGSFYTSIQNVDLDEYDIVFKVHSKGIHRRRLYMYKQLLKRSDWFLYLFEGVLGAGNVHKNIDKLLHDSRCGMIAAGNLIVHDPKHKQNLVKKTLEEYSVVCDVHENYFFVAGTCFAVRAHLMEQFQKQELQFTQSKRGRFSLAHCIERTMCFPAQLNGFEIVGQKACVLKRLLRKAQSWHNENSVEEALLADNRFVLEDEFVYRGIESKKIKRYAIEEMRLGDIKRHWFDGKIYKLTECAPYRYLQGDFDGYSEYCAYHQEHNLPAMSLERFNTLISSIEEKGFDDRYIIVVNEENVIMDGQHRSCVLLNKYGEDHMIKVLKIYIDKQVIRKTLGYLQKHGFCTTILKVVEHLKQ